MEVTNKVAEHYGDPRRFSLPVCAFGISYMEAFVQLKIEFAESAEINPNSQEKAEAEIREYLGRDDMLDKLLDNLFAPKLTDGGHEHQAFVKATEAVKGIRNWRSRRFGKPIR